MFSDRLVFILTNAWLYARNWRLVKSYRRRLGRWPRIANPERHSERMMWRKLVDRNPQFVVFSDKLATKDHVRARCPGLAVPRTLWEGTDADAIPDELLRGDVYVKANHGCDYNFRTRGEAVDRRQLKAMSDDWLRQRYGTRHGEWAYGGVAPRLFVEEAVGDTEAGMVEFQIRAAVGECILGSAVGHAKTPNQWAVYFDETGCVRRNAVGFAKGLRLDLPEGVEDVGAAYREAWKLTRVLSAGVDYARFDFLWNGTTLYGGEITVYPGAGINEIDDPEVNAQLRAGWRLENSWFLRTPQPWPASVYAAALRRRQAGR